MKAYYAMLHDLGNFLNDNYFFWGGQVRCSNRIYFDVDGNIDYYLFNFEEGLTETKQNQFKELLTQFIANFEFDLKPEKQFAQCSPVNYRNPL